MDVLTCTRCGVVKPTADFYVRRDRRKPRPLQPCRACKVVEAKALYQRKRPILPEGQKRCPRCETIKPIWQFGENAARHDGRQVYCAECWPKYIEWRSSATAAAQKRRTMVPAPSGQKVCGRCGQTKKVRAFGKNRRSSDGRTAWCRQCRSEVLAIQRPSKRRLSKPPEGFKRCWRCKEVKPVDAFRGDRSRLDGKSAGCKACELAYRAQRMRDDPEYAKRMAARRMVNDALIIGVLVRQPCEVCGNPKSDAHHVDYNKPLEVRWLCDEHHKTHGHGGDFANPPT